MANNSEDCFGGLLSEEDLSALDFNNSINAMGSSSTTTTIAEEDCSEEVLAAGSSLTPASFQFSAVDKDWPFVNVVVRGHKLQRAQLLLGGTSASCLVREDVQKLTLSQLLDEVRNGADAASLSPSTAQLFKQKDLYTAWRCDDGVVIATQQHDYVLEGTSLTLQCFWSAVQKRQLIEKYGKTARSLNGIFTSPSNLVGEFYNDSRVRAQLDSNSIYPEDISALRIKSHHEWKRTASKGTSIKYGLKAFQTLGRRVMPARDEAGQIQINRVPSLVLSVSDATVAAPPKKKGEKRKSAPVVINNNEASTNDADDEASEEEEEEEEEAPKKVIKKAPVKKSPPKKKKVQPAQQPASKAPVLTSRTTLNSLVAAIEEAEKSEEKRKALASLDESEKCNAPAASALPPHIELFHGYEIDLSYDMRTDDGTGTPPDVARAWVLKKIAAKERAEKEASFAVASETESALRRDFDEQFAFPVQPPPEMMVEDQMIKIGLDRLDLPVSVVIPCPEGEGHIFPRPMMPADICKKVLRAPRKTRLEFLRKNQPGRFVPTTEIAPTSFCIQDAIIRDEIKDRVPDDKDYCAQLLDIIDKILILIIENDGELPARIENSHLVITRDAYMMVGLQMAYGWDDLEEHYSNLC